MPRGPAAVAARLDAPTPAKHNAREIFFLSPAGMIG
jgi:hypothetical protein